MKKSDKKSKNYGGYSTGGKPSNPGIGSPLGHKGISGAYGSNNAKSFPATKKNAGRSR